MDKGIRQPPCDRPDLAALLAREPELPSSRRAEIAAHARGCPRCGPARGLLDDAERWLAAASGRRACPAADELYDFGGGPGSTPLAPARRSELETHLTVCGECRALVATLEVAPPQPILDQQGPAEPIPAEPVPFGARRPTRLAPEPENAGPASRRRAPRPSRRSWMRALPLAAAALLAVTALVLDPDWIRGADASGFHFPTAPLLRGPDTTVLRFPAGPMLALEPANGEEASGGRGTLSPVRFELDPPAGAERYRIVLRRHDGGAFAAGEALVELESTEPDVATDLALAPGHYTWEAWAERDGLERRLGAADFQVVADPALLGELHRLDRVDDPERTQRGLLLLHEHGFLTDARALARRLPPGPERDAYLASFPAR